MKHIKTKVLLLGKKIKTLPKKYLILGGVLLLLVVGGIGMLAWQLAGDDTQEAANTSTRKTPQQSASQDGAGDDMTETGNSASANPDDATSSNAATSSGSSSNSSNSSNKKTSGGGSNVAVPAPQADTSKPSTPTGFTVVNGPGVSRLMGWNASSDNVGVAGYHIYRMSTSNEAPTRIIDTITDGSTDDTEGDDTPLLCNTAGSTSYYAVRAFDAAGNLSDPVMASITDQENVNCYPIGT